MQKSTVLRFQKSCHACWSTWASVLCRIPKSQGMEISGNLYPETDWESSQLLSVNVCRFIEFDMHFFLKMAAHLYQKTKATVNQQFLANNAGPWNSKHLVDCFSCWLFLLKEIYVSLVLKLFSCFSVKFLVSCFYLFKKKLYCLTLTCPKPKG